MTNGIVALSWPTCTNNSYQVERLIDSNGWHNFSPPLPAGPDGTQTFLTAAETNRAFFRVRADALANTVVPSAAGIYSNLNITVDGLLRRYHLYIPPSYDPATAHPVAILMHGHGQTASAFASQHPDLFRIAATNRLIMVFPDGVDGREGTGWSIFDPLPQRLYIDDVSYITNLLERLDATLSLDRRRIYAGGYSMGGSMSYYLGGRTTNIFAAFAAVESSLGSDRNTRTQVFLPPIPAEPMPVLIVNATNSCTRPYYGGLNGDGTYMTPAIDAAYHWTNANLCASIMTVTTNSFVTNNMRRFAACGMKPPVDEMQRNQVVTMHWQACSPRTEVIFVTLTDGGHIWSDAADNVGYDANEEVLGFFLRHSRP